MKVLVIGGGGREHAIVWKLSQSSSVDRIFWTPGNPAAKVAAHVSIPSLNTNDFSALADFAKKEHVDLTVVGPEAPLVAGISEIFQNRGLAIFGPTKAGAQLEGSKVFSKEFFLKHKIPTGRARAFSNYEEALAYSKMQPKPLVLKADGLAAGKGVVICVQQEEVQSHLAQIMKERIFGEAGQKVLIEECLTGTEVSIHAITDGKSYQMLPSVQDHKRVFDHDEGPNTGGMGTYSPAPIFTPALEERVRREVFDRTLTGLREEGVPYCGVLYAGLMLTPEGPKILEYNCRFGDPETQVLMMRLKSDLGQALLAACRGELDRVRLDWSSEAAVCVILAANGYPGPFKKGDVIRGLDAAAARPHSFVFHAGTTVNGRDVVTQGGRVLGVTARGADLREAIRRAYEAADLIQFDGKHCRRDIGSKALN